MMAQAAYEAQGFVRFVLVGKNAGKTLLLRASSKSAIGYRFRNGICVLNHADAEKAQKGLAQWAAFPDGSAELKVAQQKWEAEHGSTKTRTAPGPVQPAGQGSGQGSTNTGAGSDKDSTGKSGPVPHGGGPERTPRSLMIEEHCGKFNHDMDEHWTSDGKPNLKLLQQMCSDDTITRAEVDEVGYRRNANAS